MNSGKEADEREFKFIDSLMSTDIFTFTDIECRMIASYNELVEKQAAIYRIIMAKGKEAAVNLTEIIKIIQERSKTVKNVISIVQEEYATLEKRNPFLNNTVLTCLFDFFSLDDIKNSRLVCRQWNSTAEIYLRKRSAICFYPEHLNPNTFMAVSKYTLPDLPFSSYRFSDNKLGRNLPWQIDVLRNFFDNCGGNIKEIEFKNVILIDDSELPLQQFDLTPWIERMPNLSILKISCLEKTSLEISIDKLYPLKTLLLKNCTVFIKKETPARLALTNVSLNQVTFKKFGTILKNYIYNNFFDFNVATNIYINGKIGSAGLQTFDMTGIIFKANQLILHSVKVKNWEKAKGDVEFLKLVKCEYFTKNNQLNVTSLVVDRSEIDFTVLPISLEKLRLGERINFTCSEPFHLSNLRQLTLHLKMNDYRMLTHFKRCPNLLEMEIIATSPNYLTHFQLNYIPKSVRKLSIESDFLLHLSGYKRLRHLDTLILADRSSNNHFSFYKTAVEKIKPKILIIHYIQGSKLDVPALTKTILSKIINKIIVGTLDHESEIIKFAGIPFYESVDNKSGCYVFENQVGREITREEFKKWSYRNNESDRPFIL